MDFPAFGDAHGYLGGGALCAQSIQGDQFDLHACYSSLRPVGILLYYAIPFLLTSDEVTVSYLALALNIIFFLVLWVSVRSVLKQQAGYGNSGPFARKVFEAALLLGILACCVPFIPVRLADHQSLALFMAGFALLATRDFQPSAPVAFGSGVLAGCAVLLKQNYVVAVAVLVVLLVSTRWWARGRLPMRPVLFFALGSSIMLVQVVLTYRFAGVPWFYEPAALEQFASSNRQPAVELLAYSVPKHAAYLSSLDREVSALAYFSTKFYHGISRFYWSVYLGKPPFDTTPVLLTYSDARLLAFQAAFIATALFAAASVVLRNRSMFVLVMTALATTCVGTAMAHTEYRYFLFFRVAMLAYMVELACLLVIWKQGRFRS
jgi:hypothetical protein